MAAICMATSAAELLEVRGLRDEVRLAVDLEQHADAVVAVHVRGDDALAGQAPRLLGGGGEALLAQVLDRLLLVAVGLGRAPSCSP
jgi:hypothetical protein